MKKIVILLLTTILLSGFFDEIENPNGKPFTLNIKLDWNKNLIKDQEFVPNVNINMPVFEYLTFHLGINADFYGNYYLEKFDWGTYLWENFDHPRSLHYINIGLETHLPLYKLWE